MIQPMKITLLLSILAVGQLSCSAQDSSVVISPDSVRSIENVLASDAMRGRATYSPDIDRAADYIIAQFKSAGLQPLPNLDGYKQTFGQITTKLISASGTVDGQPANPKTIIGYTNFPQVIASPENHFTKVYIRKGDVFRDRFNHFQQTDSNLLVIVDTSFAATFKRYYDRTSGRYKSGTATIFLLTATDPKQWTIQVNQEIKQKNITNVVGILPGRSAAKQFVIFSAHYDHLGVQNPATGADSIYNGANDDASGVTAVIELAKYYHSVQTNERSLIFVAFAGEELGALGSTYFSAQFDPTTVSAMFNIEMIGTESKWGKNSAYITGFDKTDMGAIMQKNLAGSPFHFYPDPYPEQGLFLRSDNASLAKQGVPAHTISTSKMDNEAHYHTVGDEVSTLDLQNMAEIIRSVAISAQSIVAGKDTPTRVK